NDGDPLARAQTPQPLAGAGEFLGQGYVDQVAGHRDVIGVTGGDVIDDEVEDSAQMDVLPILPPGQPPGQALVEQAADLVDRPARQMRVGKMRQHEHATEGSRWGWRLFGGKAAARQAAARRAIMRQGPGTPRYV